jgi:hypothetical protein
MPRQKTSMPNQKIFKKHHQRKFRVTSHVTSQMSVHHTDDEERQTQAPLLQQGSKPPLYSSVFASIFAVRELK